MVSDTDMHKKALWQVPNVLSVWSRALGVRWYSSGCAYWTCMPGSCMGFTRFSPSPLSSLTSDILEFVKAADTGNQPDW